MAIEQPWWESSFVWDAITTGGAGLTAPVFYATGSTNEVVTKQDIRRLLHTGCWLVVGSIAGDILGYSIYDTLRRRGWSSWKAGAAAGGLGGVVTMAVLAVTSMFVKRPLVPILVPKGQDA